MFVGIASTPPPLLLLLLAAGVAARDGDGGGGGGMAPLLPFVPLPCSPVAARDRFRPLLACGAGAVADDGEVEVASGEAAPVLLEIEEAEEEERSAPLAPSPEGAILAKSRSVA